MRIDILDSDRPAGYQLSSEELHARQQQLVPPLAGPVVIAASIRSAANYGMIFRICEAVACREIVFVDTPVQASRHVRRIARHTLDRLPSRQLSLDKFGEVEFPPLVALEITSRSVDLYSADLPRDMAFVVGGERHGIPEQVLAQCVMAVHIPMFGVNSSMNVATSLGIALYEWHRRFRHAQGS